MKTRDLIVAAGVILLATSCGSTTTTTSGTTESARAAVEITPPITSTEFQMRYPTATNVEWSRYNEVPVIIDWDLTGWPAMTTTDYVVRYNMDNRLYYGYYDANGNWIGNTYAVTDYSGLPAPVNSMLSTKYPGYTLTSVNTAIWKDHDAYQLELKNATTKVKMLVDMNGNIIKEKTKAL